MTDGIFSYKKIIVVGSGGSGKSVFSRRLGEVTGLPVIHLDNEFWQPGWVETPKAEWVEKQKKLISGDRWIIDGNYGGTLEMRFTAAEAVVFLDISRVVCVLSAMKRTGKKRPDLPRELTEPGIFDKQFREFAGWIWKYPQTGRKKVLALHEKYPDKPFIRIKHRRELDRLLRLYRS